MLFTQNLSRRPGDLARIEEHSTSSRKPSKSKKATDNTVSKGVEGVVYKVEFSSDTLLHITNPSGQVSDVRIVIAVDPSETSSDDVDLPDRCRVIKLANIVTYDRSVLSYFACLVSDVPLPRMEKTLEQLEKITIMGANSARAILLLSMRILMFL